MVNDWIDYSIAKKIYWDNQKLCQDLKPGLPEYETVVAHIPSDSDCGKV
jgi:hypothetical protein